jgi:CoA:oxalate CoA-transferase
MSEGALSDLKVLEFGNLVSAAYCTKMMADLGAEVIKIERPGRGDEARRRGPFAKDLPGPERSGLFSYLNTNKLSVTLNPETARGKKIFFDLIKTTDILVENQAPKRIEDLGLTYERLEKINPKLIMVSITPFGQTGPCRDYQAHELTTYNACGFGFLTTATREEPVLKPVKAGGRQSEFGAGQAAAVAALCAVFARDQMGEGQHIDLSIQELMAGQGEATLQHWVFAENEMGGVTDAVMMPIMPLRCSDGWVFLMCVEDDQYDRLVVLLGNPEWAESELFADRFLRAEYIDALAPLLTEWSLQFTKEQVFKMCQEAHIPVGPSYNAKEILENEHLAARGYFIDIDHPEIGRVKYPAPCYRLSQTPWKIKSPAPFLGQHNPSIYSDRLGYSREDLVTLYQAGVI